jgi:predicted nucleic acid-binding protein
MSLPNRVAVDASVAIKWVIGETGRDEAAMLLDRQLVAPDLICPECANILWKKVMRGELSAEEAQLAAQGLEGAELDLVTTRRYLARALSLAVALNHPTYDCIYLAVVDDLDLPLITADARLVRKVRESSVRHRKRVIDLADLPRLI